MIRIPGPIPITIRPIFWIFAALIGFLYSQTLVGTFIWIGIIFVSVLFHEFGHALTAKMFGKKPRIELVALGGLTVHDSQDLPYWKQFLITFDGPLFGFILALISLALSKLSIFAGNWILRDLFVVNCFWTVVNLIPVLPLDGGQLLRIVLERIFGTKGDRYALMVGLICALAISFFFFAMQSFLIGALFFLFGFQCFEMWRSTRKMEDSDRKQNLREMLIKAEEALVSGNIGEAMGLFRELRSLSKKGLIWSTATQQLALLEYEQGNRNMAYSLLLEVQKDLGDEPACILHELAFEEKNYKLVADLSARAFQTSQELDVAIRSAGAFAQMGEVKPAIGWLHAALEKGLDSTEQIIASPLYDPIRHDPGFVKFLSSIK
jgi:stage IV sporulation protein FB